MAHTTDTIRYNVNERGRAHRGKDRNFDLRALTALVNSPEIQERVRNRDLVGYYGHWQRMRFGMTPPETVIMDGKSVNIEPAIVTTYLRAEADGTIEHRTEFLDTASGKVAARLHKSKAGGFSSAINATARGNLSVPVEFAGFDYVLEPNYTTNRGYVFDGVAQPGEGSIFDFVMQEQHQNATVMAALYDGLQGDHALALQTLAKLQEDNEELLSLLASRGGAALFDGVGAEAIAPRMVSKQKTEHFARTAAMFKGATLAVLERLPDKKGDMILDQVSQHYGVAR
ncbi:MAG: hypothetical protein WKG03_00765 [Telluria sp.]